MTRRPDMRCRICDGPMWRHPRSLPEGLATCRPCRRELRERNQKVTEALHPTIGKAHLQAEFLIELLLKNDHSEVKRVIQSMPPEDVFPLLGAALIYGAEAMRDHWGTKGALDKIAAARQEVGLRSPA